MQLASPRFCPFTPAMVNSPTDRVLMKKRIMPVLKFVLRGLLYLVYISVWVEVALQGFYYVTVGDFLFRRIALPIFARDPYAGFGNRPGLSFDHRTNEFRARYITNQAGFRVPRPDLEYTLAKPSDTYRIMLLGASFAFGWGVDYELSFAGVLQHLLQEGGFAGKKKIEIINAGVPAMTTAAQLIPILRLSDLRLPNRGGRWT